MEAPGSYAAGSLAVSVPDGAAQAAGVTPRVPEKEAGR